MIIIIIIIFFRIDRLGWLVQVEEEERERHTRVSQSGRLCRRRDRAGGELVSGFLRMGGGLL